MRLLNGRLDGCMCSYGFAWAEMEKGEVGKGKYADGVTPYAMTWSMRKKGMVVMVYRMYMAVVKYTY